MMESLLQECSCCPCTSHVACQVVHPVNCNFHAHCSPSAPNPSRPPLTATTTPDLYSLVLDDGRDAQAGVLIEPLADVIVRDGEGQATQLEDGGSASAAAGGSIKGSARGQALEVATLTPCVALATPGGAASSSATPVVAALVLPAPPAATTALATLAATLHHIRAHGLVVVLLQGE